MMEMNVTLLGTEERRNFDKLMMNGNLGTPATPYEEWLKTSVPYSVLQDGEMTLEQAVKNIMHSHPTDFGHIKLVSSKDDYLSTLSLVYGKGNIVIGEMFFSLLRNETAEILYMELRDNNRNWVIKVDGIPDLFKSGFKLSRTY